MKTKKIWELEDYKGYMPSEHDLIPAIDVNGDADSTTDFDWDPKAPGAYDNAVTRKLTFGQIKEQMTLMSAKALCNVLGTTLETLTGYKQEPEPTPQSEPEQTGSETGAAAESEEDGPVIPPNGLAYIINHAYSWLDRNLIDLTGYLEEYIAICIRDAENGIRTRSASSPALFNSLRMTKYVNVHWFDTILSTLSDAILGLDNGAFSWLETLIAGVILPKVGLPDDYIKIGTDGRYHCPGPVFKSIDAEQQFDNKECLPMYGRSVWEYSGSASEGSWSRYVYEEQDNVPAGYKNISVVEWDGFFFGGMYSILADNTFVDVLGPRAVVGGSIEGYKKAYIKADPDQITTVDFTFCGIGYNSDDKKAIESSYPALLYKGTDPETGAVVYINWPGTRTGGGSIPSLHKQFYETKADWDKAWADFRGEVPPAAPAHFPAYGRVGVPALKSGTGEINLLEDGPTLHRYVAPSDNSVLWVDSYLIDGGYYTVPEKYTVDDGDGWYGEKAEIAADGTWKFYAAKDGYRGDPGEERVEEIVEWVKNVDDSGVVTQVRFAGEPPVPEDYCEKFTYITILDPDTPLPKAPINISVDRAFLDETLRVRYGNDLFGDADSTTMLGNLRTVTWTKMGNDWVPDVQYHWTSKILVKTANLNKFIEANACGLEGTTADFRVTNFKWTHEESVRTDRSFWAGALMANFTGAQLEKALGNLIFNKLNPKQSNLSPVETSPVDNSYNGDNATAPVEPVADGNDDRDPSNPDQR